MRASINPYNDAIVRVERRVHDDRFERYPFKSVLIVRREKERK